jgi:hypothetical protein
MVIPTSCRQITALCVTNVLQYVSVLAREAYWSLDSNFCFCDVCDHSYHTMWSFGKHTMFQRDDTDRIMRGVRGV